MTNEQCTNVAEAAWNLAHEPDTDFYDSFTLKDCAFTIKELQSRIAELEKDEARYAFVKTMSKEMLLAWRGMYGFSDDAIDSAMQKD